MVMIVTTTMSMLHGYDDDDDGGGVDIKKHGKHFVDIIPTNSDELIIVIGNCECNKAAFESFSMFARRRLESKGEYYSLQYYIIVVT